MKVNQWYEFKIEGFNESITARLDYIGSLGLDLNPPGKPIISVNFTEIERMVPVDPPFEGYPDGTVVRASNDTPYIRYQGVWFRMVFVDKKDFRFHQHVLEGTAHVELP